MAAWILILAAIVTVSYAAVPGIVRPCRLDDYKCIGDNLKANSYCKQPVKGYIPNTYMVPIFPFDTPYFNASYIDRDLIVKNHDKCFVSEFHVNSKSAKIIIGIDCPFLDLESNRTLIQYKEFQEPSIYNFHVRGVYPLIRITIVLSTQNGMNLCNSEIFTQVKQLPILDIKPQDRPTAAFLTRDLSLLNVYETENFYYRGKPLAKIFVDTLLCNYGCAL